MPHCRRRFPLALSLALLLAASTASATDWPAFRGPQGDSRIAAPGLFSGEQAVVLETAWKKEIGSGYAGVAVTDGRLYTLFSDGTNDAAGAFDAASGDEIWRHAFAPTYEGHDGSHTGPLATPLVADGRMIALGPFGQLFALAADTGKPLWQHHLVDDFGAVKPYYGFTTSPILAAGVLVVEVGAGEGKTIMGFDPATGEKRWSVGNDAIGYQSPLAMEVGGKTLLLAAGDAKLFGIDPASGELLFEHVHGGDAERDGSNSMNPVPAGPNQVLLTRSWFDAVLLEITESEGKVGVQELWVSNAMGKSYSPPVYHDGHFYAFSSRALTCVDAATGERIWRSRLPGDGYLVLADGHLAILTAKGGVHIARADPGGYQEIAALDLFETQVWTYPAVAGDSLYLRGLTEVARVAVTRTAQDSAGSSDEAAGASSGGSGD